MEDRTLNLSTSEYSLLTDLYQLTMTACYVGEEISESRASFEMFVRRLPENFGYLIAMGLTQVLDYLQKLQFNHQQIEALQQTGIFQDAPSKFWSLLESGSFTGDVWAIEEGTPIFPNEPFFRIEAPLWQAQLVETYILNTINYQTLIATKAARIRDIAGEEAILLEFGSRRAFSPQGAIWAARAALAAGFDGTSNVLAALKLGQKPQGTMAHALVMAINAKKGSEDEAFAAFHRYFPSAPLLIDTFDTLEAAKDLANKVKTGEIKVTGVRLDSGDLVKLSQEVRQLLPDIKIFASGDLDEWEVQRLNFHNASIDGYGFGTKLVTGAPVNGVYKLVEIDGIPTMKQSSNKTTYPGRKQIFRKIDNSIYEDRLGLFSDKIDCNELPLLNLVMKEGKVLTLGDSLHEISQRIKNSLTYLPVETRQLNNPKSIKINISETLESLRKSLINSQ